MSDATVIQLDAEALRGMITAALLEATVQVNKSLGGKGVPDMPSAWVKQRPYQVRKMGEDLAPWYCYWIDPDGVQRSKTCGEGRDGERSAQKYAKQVEAELLTGTYGTNSTKTWTELRQEYEEKIASGLAEMTRKEIRTTLGHFERLAKPGKVSRIRTGDIDGYKAKRRLEPGLHAGTTVSPCTLNKELRHLKAVLKKAVAWGYLAKLPDIGMDREPKKIPRYVPPEHFATLYLQCSQARFPTGQTFAPADWWRALLTLGYMTGWRIEEMLTLPRADVDLVTGEAWLRYDATKGKADELIRLHPVVIEHLKKLPGFTDAFFPWPHRELTIYRELHRLCDLAGVPHYGFHDLRRAFATMNADRMTADALQVLMRHQSYETTKRYLAVARQLDPAVANLHVPDVLKERTG